MSQAKHTPGPWVRYKYGAIKAAGDTLRVNGVALPCGGRPSDFEEIEANTRLIAAAPCLLEALILMVRTHDEPAETLLQEVKEQQWLEKARAAIAKATGGE